MKQKKITVLILVVVFALLLAGAGILYAQLGEQWAPDNLLVQTPTTQPAETSGTKAPTGDAAVPSTQPTETTLSLAPDFTVYDAEGNAVALSDFFGKPIVLNFWASWCGPCQSEMPTFQQAYLEQGQDIQFLMINTTTGRETLESATGFIADSGYTFPVFYDTSGMAAYVYNIYYLPTTYFIDAQGQAVAMATSAINAEMLQQGIDMITSEDSDG